MRNAASAAVLAALALATSAPRPALAHPGHGDAPPGVVVIAPRAEGRVGQVEALAEFSGGTLAVFLSRFADGAPVVGAKVEVSSDLQSATLAETDAGVYVTKDILFADGRNDIAVAFTLKGAAQTLPLTITIAEPHPPAAAAATAPAPAGRWPVGEIGGGIGLGVVVLLGGWALLRRRRPAAAA